MEANQKASENKQNSEQEIKPLFEDMKGHTHDDTSFQKAMAVQNTAANQMKEQAKQQK